MKNYSKLPIAWTTRESCAQDLGLTLPQLAAIAELGAPAPAYGPIIAQPLLSWLWFNKDIFTAGTKPASAEKSPSFPFWDDMIICELNAKVRRSDVRKAYESYCDERGLRRLSPRELVQIIKNHGAGMGTIGIVHEETGTRGSRKAYLGIRLRTHLDD